MTAAAAQEQSTPPAARPLRLEDLERMALENNPTLTHAAAKARAAAGHTKQAGRHPHPIIGATGDEISQNPTFRGGEFGMFGIHSCPHCAHTPLKVTREQGVTRISCDGCNKYVEGRFGV